MKHPEIEVLLATYNGAQYLEQQLNSLFEQSSEAAQITIRDDQSSDQTPSLLSHLKMQYPEKIHLLTAHERVGVVGNFSRLLSHSQAPYVMFCDQDDLWLPKKIEKSWKALNQLEERFGRKMPCLIFTDLTVVDNNLSTIHPSFWKYSKICPKKDSFNHLLMQNIATGCTMMLNRPLIDLCSPLPTNIIMHDWWIALVATAFGKIGFVNEATILYRQHNHNQVGAHDRRMISLLTSGWQGLQKQKEHTRRLFPQQQEQARAFLSRFSEKLSLNQKATLQAFEELPYTSYLGRAHLMVKFGLYKQGIPRNLLFWKWIH